MRRYSASYCIYFKLQMVAEQAAMKALQMFVTMPNLDNFIFSFFEPMQRRENNMASKHRFKVSLPTGEKVWASGDTIDEMFANFAQKYGSI